MTANYAEPPTSRRFHRSRRLVEVVILFLTVLCAASSVLRLDAFPAGMILTYPPRVLLILSTIYLLLWQIRKNERLVASALTVSLGIFIGDLTGYSCRTHSVSHLPSSGHDLNLLTMNVHEATGHVAELRDICRQQDVGIVMLQEVKPENHSAFIDGLPEYQFFRTDQSQEFECSWMDAFSLLTGVRRDLLASSGPVRIETGLTGYRTFATQVSLRGSGGPPDAPGTPVWLVNVHCTKPFFSSAGISGAIRKAAWKSRRHMQEFEVLNDWIQNQGAR